MDAYLYGRRLVFLGVDARDQIHVSWRVWSSGAGCFLKVEGASHGQLWSKVELRTHRAQSGPAIGQCAVDIWTVVSGQWLVGPVVSWSVGQCNCSVQYKYRTVQNSLVRGWAASQGCQNPVNGWLSSAYIST